MPSNLFLWGAHIRWEMCEVDHFFVAEKTGALDNMAELADVPGPGVCFQRFDCPWRDAFDIAAHSHVNLAQESSGQGRDIADALA